MFSHSLKCLKAALHSLLSFCALVDPLTLPPDGALDSVPWLHQTLQKSSHHDQTTGWPRLRGNVIFTCSSQYNPLVCIGSSRYSIPLCTGSSARARNASFTDNPSVRLPSFHPFMYIRLPLYLNIGSHTSLLFLLFRNDPFIHIGGSACFPISNWFIVTHRPTSTSKGQILQ